jgi:hypothetical protein
VTGISVVVLSYERPHALAVLLQTLIEQELDGLALELIVWNNSPRVQLARAPDTPVARLLARFDDVKVIDSGHNWETRVRYALGLLARHETVFFIDDDLAPADTRLVRDMYEVLHRLNPVDVVSCWTALWTEWNDNALTQVRMGFLRPGPAELTECDHFGPGICMFRREILRHPAIAGLLSEAGQADSQWFPWLTSMKLGTRKYYMPSYGRMQRHPEFRHAALADRPGSRAAKHAAYKRMWQEGYEPVLARQHDRLPGSSPELRAAATLPLETDPW